MIEKKFEVAAVSLSLFFSSPVHLRSPGSRSRCKTRGRLFPAQFPKMIANNSPLMLIRTALLQRGPSGMRTELSLGIAQFNHPASEQGGNAPSVTLLGWG